MTNHQLTTASTEVKPIAVIYQATDGAQVTIRPTGVIACDCRRYRTNARLFVAECDHTRAVQAYRLQPLARWTH